MVNFATVLNFTSTLIHNTAPRFHAEFCCYEDLFIQQRWMDVRLING